MKGLMLGLLLCATCATSALGAEMSPRVKKEMDAIHAVIEANFQASNSKDVQGVMKTMTPYTPNREEFVVELKKFFDEVDVYLRLLDVKLVSAEMTSNGPAATVRVTQHTMGPKDDDTDYSEFRTRSAMLPPYEVCEFNLVMHKVRGKWLAHTMGGDVKEVSLPEDIETVEALQSASR